VWQQKDDQSYSRDWKRHIQAETVVEEEEEAILISAPKDQGKYVQASAE